MIILASTPAPSTDGGTPDPDLVTPGTIGFLATFAVIVVAIFLIRDALRRVRRVRARSGTTDAYPIPLRRHVVPNQSKLSGPEDPEPADAAEQKSGEDEPTEEESAASESTQETPTDADAPNGDSDRRS
ncbi:hypothetical protein [Brevibacterium spongiae]|uniref:Uncharacterized protein n=1 Tax=Brevibacterium spongiae TaxID=2909672 RepID=A0ABY5SXN6_9MICO|nr:hypothetical protein [Brevibacterium spongiae]UVI37459.1 hypothetical protein L1F31_07385 [Brevibacterium spongiae]